jgi:hypothetical protein
MPGLTRSVRDRSRAVNKLLRALTRSLRSRTGESKEQVQRLTEQIAAQARLAVGQAQKLLEEACPVTPFQSARQTAPGHDICRKVDTATARRWLARTPTRTVDAKPVATR